jgi:hypothetical protein
MFVVSPRHRATSAALSVRRLRRTVTIDRITLERVASIDAATGTLAESHQWYYEIGFIPPESTAPHGDSYRVWVLMDGTVVAATGAAQVEQDSPANGSPPFDIQ